MKLSRKLMIAAAAGAIGAASASSALAFDNEIHGSYLIKYFVTNYEAVANSYILGSKSAVSASESRKTSNYFDTRARFYYTAKANDDLKLVTAFEIDSEFGDSSQSNGGRGNGGALESDSVNLETKWMYLNFKVPSTPVTVMAGIMPVKDKLKGIFFDADVAGINTVTTLGPATMAVGYFRAYDANLFSTSGDNSTSKGTDDLDIVAASLDYNVTKDLRVGGAYYLYSDNRTSSPLKVHVFGLNADAKIDKLSLSGFVAAQTGRMNGDADKSFSGYAFNAAAKHPVGPGNLRVAGLYTTGDDGDNTNTAWQAVNQSPYDPTDNDPKQALTNANKNMTNSYNESGMILLNRNLSAGGTTTDMHIVQGTGNQNQGVILATIGYDAKINPKWYANGNVGAAWVSRTNEATRATTKGCNFMGTEFNVETGYKLYDNLTASIQAAYVLLGGYYTKSIDGDDPKDPFTTRINLSYAF